MKSVFSPLLVVAVVATTLSIGATNTTSAATSGRTYQIQVGGTLGVPADAEAVALNLTVTDATEAGHVTAYPCGATQPTTSNLNYVPGPPTSKSAIVVLGTGGKVCISTLTDIKLIVDVTAAFPAGSSIQPVGPNRIMDTRPNGTTISGGDTTRTPLHAGHVHQLQVGGTSGIPGNAEAVALNFTVTDAAAAGHITAFPCGATQPTTSNVNYVPGPPSTNSAIIGLGIGGKVCISALTSVNVIVDVSATFPAGSSIQPVGPNRIMDTRPGGTTISGGDPTRTPLRAGRTHQLQVGGTSGVASSAAAVALNFTVTDAAAAGHVTVFPCGTTQPTTSNLNYVPGPPTTNSAIIGLGTGGKVCINALTDVNVIVDVTASFPAAADLKSITPNRLADTRIEQPPSTPNPPATNPPATNPPDTGSPTPPPAGALFSENFAGNTGLGRFATGVFHRDDTLVTQTSWHGDHDMNCGSPATSRTIHRSAPTETFYHCKDHLMTSVGDTSGYSVAWFSPNQTFATVREVCWSVNLTNLGSRQWWKVAVLSTSAPNVMSEVAASELSGITGSDRAVASWGGVGGWKGKMRIGEARMDWYSFDAGDDKATRYPACFRDNGNGTLTFTMTGPKDGGAVATESYTTSGRFPAGPVKVVFQDHNYTPTKSDNGVGTPIGYTWHWDDIVIR